MISVSKEILIVKLFHQYSFDDQSEEQLLNAFINQKPLPIEKVETLRSYITMVKSDTNISNFFPCKIQCASCLSLVVFIEH